MEKKTTEKTSVAAELFFWAQALTVALAVLVCCNTFFFRLSGPESVLLLRLQGRRQRNSVYHGY